MPTVGSDGSVTPVETERTPNGTETDASGVTQGPLPAKKRTLNEIASSIRNLINGENPMAKRPEICSLVTELLKAIIAGNELANKYNWLIIHDTLGMIRSDTDKIYKAINEFEEQREIALVVTSNGGEVEPAYLISKLCRESTTGKFVAVVPRNAKSAATLVCCGADEIHMGQMSELGPIDPQINKLPALGLKNSVEHLAELVSKYPDASGMFATYLSNSLTLVNLGYYERVAESAMQYADRLLAKRVAPLKGTTISVARQLVYGYKDHGFVIDQNEAASIFGDAMIKAGSPEYILGNIIYEWLAYLERMCESAKFTFYMYGSVDSDCVFFKND